MPEHSIASLQASLREEKMIYEAALEDVSYHNRMALMRKNDAQRASNHIADLEETIASLAAEEN